MGLNDFTDFGEAASLSAFDGLPAEYASSSAGDICKNSSWVDKTL